MLDPSPPKRILAYVAHFALLTELSEYTGFGPDDHAVLRALGPRVEPRLDGIVDAFYRAIEANPGARAVFDDDAQIARQKQLLRAWLSEIFGGTYDEAYFERRARIGRVHVRIHLDQRYMISGMNLVRVGLHEAIRDLVASDTGFPYDAGAAHGAVDRICDLELAIMLETYKEDYDARTRSTEKLATLGQLAATIGHELRNPLAVMETSLHLLSPRLDADPSATRHVTRLGEQVALCSSIIEDLLELARDRPVERATVELDALIGSALAIVPGGADVRVSKTDTLVRVDPGQIRQVVVNLVSNAIHAARTGPSGVSIDARRDGSQLEIEVCDDGPGIAPDVMPRLFEPLFTTRARGVGLGLSLCRRVVEKHGGVIRAENRAEGGTRFSVRLPDAIAEAR